MIQRIQTLYLLLVTVLMSLMVVMPYAEIMREDMPLLTFHANAIHQSVIGGTAPVYKITRSVITLILLIGLLSFVNILLYRNRRHQMSICLVNIALSGALLAVMFFYYNGERHQGEFFRDLRIPAFIPLLSVIITILAYRSIRSDERLVKSNDRIR
jgi:hypothetical protein